MRYGGAPRLLEEVWRRPDMGCVVVNALACCPVHLLILSRSAVAMVKTLVIGLLTEYHKRFPVSQKREKGTRALIHKYVPEKRENCTTRVWCTDIPMKNDHQLAG
ncbi:unnamed protein product [Urochloa humidicola]